jgi:phenylacetaldoxime dehydratase/aldoxime dehydratase
MIRSAQDWSSSTTFRTSFLEDVQPVKSAGMDYLNATPESGCIVAREINECDRAGSPLDRASTIAWFASLDHLSAWAKSHKTHLKIYASFFQMVAARPDDLLDVAFWHEVSVPGHVHAEYINCHPATGFLRVAESAARV